MRYSYQTEIAWFLIRTVCAFTGEFLLCLMSFGQKKMKISVFGNKRIEYDFSILNPAMILGLLFWVLLAFTIIRYQT